MDGEGGEVEAGGGVGGLRMLRSTPVLTNQDFLTCMI